MRVEDFLEKPLVVSPEDSISRAASLMFSNRKHEAVVMKNGKFVGILLARDLVKRKVSDPHKTKISGFVVDINPFLPGTGIEEIINGFLVNDYRAVPFKNNGKIMVLTKTGLLGIVKDSPVLKDKFAEDVMNFPYCITTEDSLSTARAVLRDMNISRVPVVKEGKVEGIIDYVDLLGPVFKGEVNKRGEPGEERTHIDSIPASSFMRKEFPVAEPDARLSSVIDLIVKNNSAVIVERNGKLSGIVTPGDILKLFGKEVRGAYVTISGMQEEDDFIKSVIYKEIENSLKKINKIYPVNYFVAHVDKYNVTGRRAKYSIRARVATQKGFFFSHDHGWDITKAIKGVLEKLEKEVIKRKERERGI
ncbi:MAG: CBS domain-containing protein [Candidatus Aenigmatarchaeota archaeon]